MYTNATFVKCSNGENKSKLLGVHSSVDESCRCGKSAKSIIIRKRKKGESILYRSATLLFCKVSEGKKGKHWDATLETGPPTKSKSWAYALLK